uniref:CCHC-type domain-containing protein n=1 Tax=Tanacetum cinerariifolium TaxID=118510 RepID=A0A699HRP9_TANCI|nr:hypothetical protein [Tanacetum cinerariifolium]
MGFSGACFIYVCKVYVQLPLPIIFFTMIRGVLESTRRDLIDDFYFRKQCSYITSHELPLSKYALFTCLLDMYTLITTGSDEPSFGMGGNKYFFGLSKLSLRSFETSLVATSLASTQFQMCLCEFILLAKVRSKLCFEIFVIKDATYLLTIPPYSGGVFEVYLGEGNPLSNERRVLLSLKGLGKGSGADDISELKKITALLAKAFNRRKFYSKPTNNNLRTSSTSQSANKKQDFVKSDDKKVEKKDVKKKRDMSRVKCYNCKKEGYFAKDCKKVNVKDYEYYKTKMLLAKKDKDEQVLLAEDQARMESSKASSSSADEKISKVSYYLSKSESESEYETSKYYDNTSTYGLFVNHNDDPKNS